MTEWREAFNIADAKETSRAAKGADNFTCAPLAGVYARFLLSGLGSVSFGVLKFVPSTLRAMVVVIQSVLIIDSSVCGWISQAGGQYFNARFQF